MTQPMQLLETISLENGLALNLFDSSRKIAGDRWLVSLTAIIEIPVQETLCLDGQEGVDTGAIKAALGDNVVYKKTMDRNFISDAEKEKVFLDARDSLMDSLLKYLSLPEFPKKYILKCFRESQKKQGWYPS